MISELGSLVLRLTIFFLTLVQQLQFSVCEKMSNGLQVNTSTVTEEGLLMMRLDWSIIHPGCLKYRPFCNYQPHRGFMNGKGQQVRSN
jgi:hypothetical protein